MHAEPCLCIFSISFTLKWLTGLSMNKVYGHVLTLILAVLLTVTSYRNYHHFDGPDYSMALVPLVIGIAALPVLVVGGYDIITERLVKEYDKTAPRNTETGILIGAEELDLGPADSPRAALLVHGFVGATNNFNDFPYRLAENGWHVKAMRLPGHGTSPVDMLPVSADSLIHAVRHEYEKLKNEHETVVIIGHSMGGSLAAITAAETDADAVVLCAPYFGVTHQWYYLLKAETWTHLTAPIINWVRKSDRFIQVNRREVKDQIVSYQWIPMKGVDALIELGKTASDPALLKRIDCPTLFLHSKKDIAASWQDSENAYGQISSLKKRFVWLERSNHIVFWDYDREQVTEEILDFLNDIP